MYRGTLWSNVRWNLYESDGTQKSGKCLPSVSWFIKRKCKYRGISGSRSDENREFLKCTACIGKSFYQRLYEHTGWISDFKMGIKSRRVPCRGSQRFTDFCKSRGIYRRKLGTGIGSDSRRCRKITVCKEYG